MARTGKDFYKRKRGGQKVGCGECRQPLAAPIAFVENKFELFSGGPTLGDLTIPISTGNINEVCCDLPGLWLLHWRLRRLW